MAEVPTHFPPQTYSSSFFLNAIPEDEKVNCRIKLRDKSDSSSESPPLLDCFIKTMLKSGCRRSFSISILLLISQVSSILATQCSDPTNGKTRTFENLTDYQKNWVPFNPLDFEKFQGNYVDIKTIKPNLEQNDFLAFQSSLIIRLNLSEKKITSLENNTFYSLTCLRHLNLAGNKILDVNPGSFRGLQWLAHLNLSGNSLQNLPDRLFSNLTEMKDLDLSNNKLTSISSMNFKDLRILQHLNLSHNKLSYIDLDHLNVNNVNILDLSWNNLKTFDVSLTYFMRMTRLFLNNNHLKDLNVFAIKNQIPHLALLTLDRNNWACDDLAYILRALNDSRIFYNTNHQTQTIIGGIDCDDFALDTTIVPSTSSPEPSSTPASDVAFREAELLKSVSDLRTVVNCLIVFLAIFVVFEVATRSGMTGSIFRMVRRSREEEMYDDTVENIRLIPSHIHRV